MSALRDALRRLLLPISVAHEDAAGQAVAANLWQIPDDDQPLFLALEQAKWHETGTPDRTFRDAVSAGIAAGDPVYGQRLAVTYFPAHDALRTQRYLSFDEATFFLSHARLIAYLAEEERLAAAQIARLLAARDSRADFHWQAVSSFLERLHASPQLSDAQIHNIYDDDAAREPQLFADADVREAAALVGEAASGLGFPGDADALLRQLVEDDLSTHGPYLKLLYFQCLAAEVYDHHPPTLYEFKPRSQAAIGLFNTELADIEAAQDPALNNAKSAVFLDKSWAQAKQGRELPRALALAALLEGLAQMGFLARHELASWLRPWVLRIRTLLAGTFMPISLPLTQAQTHAFIHAVAAAPTQTYGILEQRLVDALASGGRSADPGWLTRGLGDAVNASNLSRRKLGDVEFSRPATQEIIALEAHAGRLSEYYVESHLASLRLVLPQRAPELLALADARDWHVTIQLVAHEIDARPRIVDVEGFAVRLEPLTFAQFVAANNLPDDLPRLIGSVVVEPLNERRTPQMVRDRFLALLDHRPA